MDLTHQNFFLQHLQALAQNETLHTAEEIRAAAEGLKLLDRNVRLESEDLQKLAQIPLERPIYENIRFMEPLTLPAIRLHMQKAMAQSPGLQLFQRATRAPQVALDCLNQVTLPPPLLNILTVMSRQLPELYAHTLEVALISTFLGILHRMDRSELVHVMSAGLFHDIGSMFLPPSLLDRETTLSWSDWRLIYTHPSIGHDILKGVKGVPPR
ncbi:HD-GYP domain-containing protein [Methylogaea oryzae]|uniref:HD-GYP domain-containing protein n=1 Tax=Methylogaea oryzae TaxID=1295382 RepID=UPI0012E1B403|nr:HD domain-containing phosphohydrolase [Methylogaea oryzae]